RDTVHDDARGGREHDTIRQGTGLHQPTSITVKPALEYVPTLLATIKSSENPSTTAALHPCPALYGTGPSVHVTCGRATRVTPRRTPTCRDAASSGAVTVIDTRPIASGASSSPYTPAIRAPDASLTPRPRADRPSPCTSAAHVTGPPATTGSPLNSCPYEPVSDELIELADHTPSASRTGPPGDHHCNAS